MFVPDQQDVVYGVGSVRRKGGAFLGITFAVGSVVGYRRQGR